MIDVKQNVLLKDYSTMRLGGPARYLVEINSRQELEESVLLAQKNSLPVLMIGGGSNVIWQDEGFAGMVLVNKITGFRAFEEDASNVFITIGAGEKWDSMVAQTVQMNLTGIESLSLIPGSTGATVVQNVGAYGQEISQTLTNVEVFDLQDLKFKIISSSNCQLSYRSSIFKSNPKNPYLISAVTLNLSKSQPDKSKLYPAVIDYLNQNNITDLTPATIRQAVINIRSSKLPDPNVVANNGSFFTNPTISYQKFFSLQKSLNQAIPHWKVDTDNVKVAAAWLIEYSGLKDYHDQNTGFATWKTQPLVVINESGKSTRDLIAFRDFIIDTVYNKTGVTLIQEPQILP